MNQEIKQEVDYCLNCKAKPCSINGCPLNNDIPAFIKEIKQERYEEAYKILIKTTVLPSICGRICPHYKQCMGACIRGIKGEAVDIGLLESYIGDIAINNNYKIEKKDTQNRRIAIIGGGPAGLTAAAFLAKNGNKVTIYEKYNYLGGLLIHGIPEFRLPRESIKKSIDKILDLGIEVKYNKELGKNLDLQSLKKDYDSIILAFGANKSLKMNVEGENLNGVYGGNELLEYNKHPNYKDKTITIIGGGNVAIDIARTIKRLGAKKIIVVYRRGKEEMPAEKKEVEDAIKEGVEFLFKNNVVKIIGKDHVEKIELIKTELLKIEGDNRLHPVNIKNTNYEVITDIVIMAIGSCTENFVRNLGLDLNPKGYIKVNEDGQSSCSKIYAIGDVAGKIQTVALAAKSGRDVAEKINLCLT